MTADGVPVVAVLGIGNMGSAIARVLARTGHTVVAWNRTIAKAEVLGRNGVEVARSVEDALSRSSLVVMTPTGYDEVYAIVERVSDDRLFSGRTFVNLAWGTAEVAEAMDRYLTGRGASYLDGMILSYPVELGTDAGTIVYSGDKDLYDWTGQTLGTLGRRQLVGPDIGAANTIGMSAGVVFYHTALGAFYEAIALSARHGLEPRDMLPSLELMLDLLRTHFHSDVQAIETGMFETDQATIDIHIAAGRLAVSDLAQAGQRAPLMTAFVDLLAPLVEAGRGSQAISVLFDDLAGRSER